MSLRPRFAGEGRLHLPAAVDVLARGSSRGEKGDVVGEHGFTGYNLPESVPVWRQHVEELANDPEKLARMGAAARQRIAAHFSPDVRAKDYWRMYSTAIAERRSGR